MRKLLSLLLCLILFLPVTAMAEAEVTPKMYKFDFGDFTMVLREGDYYELAPEKIDGEVLAMIYPAYDESAASHDNFNIIWTKDDVSAVFAIPGGPEAYAKRILKSAKEQYESLGVKVTDEKVIAAKYEDGIGAFMTFANMDFTGAGTDLITPMYQLQYYICKGEAGSYVFTLSASTFDDLDTLATYLETIEFK